ncbi:MAG: 2-amino-4-hydroxy-6-hydroxymethyldihydropteridine diphosphokinase [Aminobacterium colombiense]|jgi:2-amino-4-hydroxy-6-hydroxymethyldihydropteridine diphosphokinase|uniref:2-amino-4-hydroxy-6-hydroxymethyldihydropteridine diphosphokinase n=1 Tax=Aminobacterium colombiense (strain DSM 12261 / ALA-1) TaxID=572547 RepID=D5EG81_AMICL|nr:MULTISPECIES: 2-amino-4-hydroxy-6-hydroxymethyldihydropteridine diphosphokinase [Aminobacterium]MDD2379697.1 2-amino-4-hydroxy-6-hydroxymethyldihydropteridine diphosphokinase [Aminobacterium colombiense]ADE57563.1 2-amino-4-hydroxy-6-hydroxymethyldihydropteridin epyrophosphokinase [Aminobacterium colombiense DSM 12261]MDD3768250.1 2-amino-4-hydroxy-6-hydroxymethyldihydropteridine diphosphokinase [Aminobacterium colombiense]MDD4265641.1 2-amino-4-hydroxy-6-hydroxymethyldihydropteridine diphos
MRLALGIGSNVGDRMNNLRKAVQLLKEKGVVIIAKSDIFETAPMGVTDQPRFLNACIVVDTKFDLEELLSVVKSIEQEMGRVHRLRWGPREIDIDLLLLENGEVLDSSTLKVPHPEMHKRAFVLMPLAQIAPDWIHPLLKVSVKKLAEDIHSQDETLLKISSL